MVMGIMVGLNSQDQKFYASDPFTIVVHFCQGHKFYASVRMFHVELF
jgi:hypothetical protein